jgi:hypothetical protein
MCRRQRRLRPENTAYVAQRARSKSFFNSIDPIETLAAKFARVEDVRGEAALPTFFIVPSVNASAEKKNEY